MNEQGPKDPLYKKHEKILPINIGIQLKDDSSVLTIKSLISYDSAQPLSNANFQTEILSSCSGNSRKGLQIQNATVPESEKDPFEFSFTPEPSNEISMQQLSCPLILKQPSVIKAHLGHVTFVLTKKQHF